MHLSVLWPLLLLILWQCAKKLLSDFLSLLDFKISSPSNSLAGVNETRTTCALFPQVVYFIWFFGLNTGSTTSSYSALFGFVRTVEQVRVWILIPVLGKSVRLPSARRNSVDGLITLVHYWTKRFSTPTGSGRCLLHCFPVKSHELLAAVESKEGQISDRPWTQQRPKLR